MAIVRHLGHAQHLIVAHHCLFHLATFVRGRAGAYAVSTVGEYMRPQPDGSRKCTEIGYGRLYETYVFRAGKGTQECGCPVIADYDEIDSLPANDAMAATVNHERLVKKWSAIADKAKRKRATGDEPGARG